MATVTRGKTFTANETVTNTKLHQLADSATVTNIDRSDMQTADTSAITIQATAPSAPTDGEHWFDTTLNLLRQYDLSETVWKPIGRGSILTNKSGGAVTQWGVVVADGSNALAFTTTTSANDDTVIGVVAETIANDAKGVVLHSGLAKATVDSAVSTARFLRTSTTAGEGNVDVSKAVDSFGVTLGSTGAAGDVDCLLFL